MEGTTFNERWLILDLENSENTVKHTEVSCDKCRPCMTLPGPDHTRRFEFKLVEGEKDEDLLAPAMVEELLRTHGVDPTAKLRRKVRGVFPGQNPAQVVAATDAATDPALASYAA